MIARQVVLCWAVDIKVRDGRRVIARRQYIINTSLPGLVGNMARHCTRVQHFPSSGKYLYTLVQYLAILPTKPGNKIYLFISEKDGFPF